MSFNIFGKRLALVSQGDLPDVYEMPRPSLDVTMFKSLGEKFQLTGSIKNILNPRVRLIHEYAGQQYVYSGNNAGISWSLRVEDTRYSLSKEQIPFYSYSYAEAAASLTGGGFLCFTDKTFILISHIKTWLLSAEYQRLINTDFFSR